MNFSKKVPRRDGAAADVILKVAGNRCKMENCVATMTGKESLLLAAKDEEDSAGKCVELCFGNACHASAAANYVYSGKVCACAA